jgi:DNA-binding MarR family transcriptional regulator/N-acetylglutamate synthase-like GNAT family acetyltransferase
MDPRVDEVREFNRFYTQKIGVLEEGLLDSAFSLTEVRVLWELVNGVAKTAKALQERLGLDAGYVSRMLAGFEQKKLIKRTPSPEDRRQSMVQLTAAGHRAFEPLTVRARVEVQALLDPLAEDQRQRLVEAMRTIESLLGAAEPQRGPISVHEPRAGDLGWVVERHGALYAAEYGWDVRFEALVAEIVARFGKGHDPARERGWIVVRDGQRIGCVFVMQKSKTTAQLRLLLVEPIARGAGLGARLVDQCIQFARDAGYREVTLWTNDVLHAARRIYERAGFKLVAEEAHDHFGPSLVGQTWSRRL